MYQIFFLIMHLLNCLSNASGFDESKQILNSKNLLVKSFPKLGLYLVKYDKEKCDMTDPDVMKCRGIIIRMDNNNVVCYPPEKSLPIQKFLEIVDYNDNGWDKVVLQDFIDGTMINVFYFNNEWILSTRSCIGGNNRWLSLRSFKDLFTESSGNIDFENLNKECCYTFVLRHNDNRIVKEYVSSGITLVSARHIQTNNTEQVVTNLDINEIHKDLISKGVKVDIPEVFMFDSYEDAFSSVGSSDYQQQGYVLNISNYRSKIRNKNYDWARNLKGNTNNLKFRYIELRQNGAVNEYLAYFPEHIELFNSYQSELFATTQALHQAYIDLHVKKIKNIKQISFELRPLCYQLHGIHLETRRPTTFAKVKNFFNALDPKLQLFTINFKYRPKPEEKNQIIGRMSPQEQKQNLGERLYPLIERKNKELAGKITGMLLEMDNSDIVDLIENSELLDNKVLEAVRVLNEFNNNM